jgi:2-keto-3-deoxy-L-rhamnonate aldolase RhmA
VKAAIERGIELIKATGKPAGFLNANPDTCKWVLEQGVTFCAVGSDVAVSTLNVIIERHNVYET